MQSTARPQALTGAAPKTSLFEGGGPPAGGGRRSPHIARPIPLRPPSRSPLYNPGCRVATLLVSMGVMGFLGDLRGRNSKSHPNPLGLAERVPRPQAVEGVRGRWKSYRISQIKIYASKRRTMRGLAAHFNLISYLIRRGQSIPCLFLAGTPAQNEKN